MKSLSISPSNCPDSGKWHRADDPRRTGERGGPAESPSRREYPCDGVIVSGQTSINQAVMTGESLPVDKTVGDPVSSGTVNLFGVFEMTAEKIGEDSSIQRMIRLVQSADADKAKIVGIADRWATWIVVIALTAAALTWAISGQIIRAVTILVVFCPCALVLATPTAIMAAIGNVAKHGFLVREGDALERLSAVKKIAFDKTGTLTYGVPKVIAVNLYLRHTANHKFMPLPLPLNRCPSIPWAKLLSTATKTRQKKTFPGFRLLKCSRTGRIGHYRQRICPGWQQADAHEHGINFTPPREVCLYLDHGCTVIYLAVSQTLAGYICPLRYPPGRK